MNTSIVPFGVRQGNEKRLGNAKTQEMDPNSKSNLDALDAYLRAETMGKKEEQINGSVLPRPLYRDAKYNNTDSRLGNYDAIVAQQSSLDNDVAAAMAANTIQNKRELWRIEDLNRQASSLSSQFGLVEASKRQYKKGAKVHRLSQQSTWM
jgi:hypothetical protein